jgi:ubiquinone/menaquinone biosynthesis C-methylase UbiE
VKDDLILDVGCGTDKKYISSPRGDINCDIEKPFLYIKNFVKCDAHYLPFRNQVFQKVVAFHLVEHLCFLSKFMTEVDRVTKENGEVEIVTPNLYSKNSWLDPNHIHHFNKEAFGKLFLNFKTKIIGYNGLWIPIRGNIFLFRKFPFLKNICFLSKNLKLTGVKKRNFKIK